MLEQKFLNWYLKKHASGSELQRWPVVSEELLAALQGECCNAYCSKVVSLFWVDYNKGVI